MVGGFGGGAPPPRRVLVEARFHQQWTRREQADYDELCRREATLLDLVALTTMRPRADHEREVRVAAPIVTRLSAVECLVRLTLAPIGRVAVSIDAMPAVRTVRFALDGNNIVFRVADGSRLQEATNDSVVAFHADHYDEATRSGWSVEVVGVAKPVTDELSVARLARLPLESWSDDAQQRHLREDPHLLHPRRTGATRGSLTRRPTTRVWRAGHTRTWCRARAVLRRARARHHPCADRR